MKTLVRVPLLLRYMQLRPGIVVGVSRQKIQLWVNRSFSAFSRCGQSSVSRVDKSLIMGSVYSAVLGTMCYAFSSLGAARAMWFMGIGS